MAAYVIYNIIVNSQAVSMSYKCDIIPHMLCRSKALSVKCHTYRNAFLYTLLTVVRCNLLPTSTAVSTQSKWTIWCNSHFIHCSKIEVGDGVWGCTRARHWASGVRRGSPSPVLHRVTSDHLTRSQCWSAPSDSDLACFIQCHHWHTTISGSRYIC